MQTRCGRRECQTTGPPSHLSRVLSDYTCNWFLTPLFHARLLTLNYRHDTALVECWHCSLRVRRGAPLLGHGGVRFVCRERAGAIESAAHEHGSVAANQRRSPPGCGHSWRTTFRPSPGTRQTPQSWAGGDGLGHQRLERARVFACRSWTWTLFSTALKPNSSVAPWTCRP